MSGDHRAGGLYQSVLDEHKRRHNAARQADLGFFSRLHSAKHHPYCLERLTRRASSHSDLPELGMPKGGGSMPS